MSETFRGGQVVVKTAAYRRGYTSRDHLLRDDDFRPIIGRVFASSMEATAAALNLSRSSAPASVETVPVNVVPAEDIYAAADRLARRSRTIEVFDVPTPFVVDGCLKVVFPTGPGTRIAVKVYG